MTDSAICRGGESIGETAVGLDNDQQAFFSGRHIKAKGVHASQSQPHAENLARTEVVVVAGGEVEDELEVHGLFPFGVESLREAPCKGQTFVPKSGDFGVQNKKAVSWKRDSLIESVSLVSFPNGG